MKKILLFLLICNSSIIFAQEKNETSKIQIVEASCGQCQFGMKEKGCDLAVRIEGKSFDDKYTLSIYLKPDLMHFRDGFIADKANNSLQANHQITSGSPKHRDQFPAQIWNFWIEKGSNKKSYYMKFIKPMSVAEFKSATYGTAKLSSNTQELAQVESSSTSNTKDLRYRLTLDRIYIEGVEDGPEGIFSGWDIFKVMSFVFMSTIYL